MPMLRTSILTCLALAALASLAGCSGAGHPSPASAASREPVIVVSVPPQAWLVERILGASVPARIEVMIPAGANSEVEAYSPTPDQMRSLEQAELYVKVGHPLISVETAYVTPLLATHPGIGVIDMGQGIPQGGDPHLWVSPATARLCARNLAAGLAVRFPAQAAAIEQNLGALMTLIDARDAEMRSRLAACPRRVFLVDHPALGYIARDYGLRQIAIEEEGKEPGLARLMEIIEEAKREGVSEVFTQTGFPPKPAELIARALGGPVIPIDILARDWDANTQALTMQLAAALGGEPPAAPDLRTQGTGP